MNVPQTAYRASNISSLLASSEKQDVRKVFVKNIPEDVPDSFVESLLRVSFAAFPLFPPPFLTN